MRKSKFILTLCVLTLIVSLCVALCGCQLRAEDCYVFDEEEFAELRKEDNSLLDSSAFRVMSANVLVHIKDWVANLSSQGHIDLQRQLSITRLM